LIKIRSQFFIKRFFLFSIPIMVCVCIMGAVSIWAVRNYVEKRIVRTNTEILNLFNDKLELIFSDIDLVNHSFITNTDILTNLNRDLTGNKELSWEGAKNLDYINKFLIVTSSVNDFIESIYLYIDNPKGWFLTSSSGLTNFDLFTDIGWFDSFSDLRKELSLWTELRIFKQYEFEREEHRVITIYRNIFFSGETESRGAIVLNLSADKINTIFDTLDLFEGQLIFLINKEGNILAKSGNHLTIDEKTIGLLQKAENFSELAIEKEFYIVSHTDTSKFGWQLLSIVPKKSFYDISIRLRTITFSFLIISIILGIFLTYILTKRNYKNIQGIITLIEQADKGEISPPNPKKIKDEYGFISESILKNFLEKNLLVKKLAEKKYKKKTLELLALQSQMNPHFLFNAMDILYWQIIGITQKPNKANKIIEHLSFILKYSLYDSEKEVTLREEIAHVKNYLEIVFIQHNNRFSVVWETPEELLDCKIMKMMLQPLVENSIKHGLANKVKDAAITIVVKTVQGKLFISVSDNGTGIPPQELQALMDELNSDTDVNDHIGLLNTQRRIRLAHGEQFGLTLSSIEGQFTSTEILLPLS